MRINKIVQKMRRNEKAYGLSLTFLSTTVMELAGRGGLDFVSFKRGAWPVHASGPG